jgi:hypothetical protein
VFNVARRSRKEYFYKTIASAVGKLELVASDLGLAAVAVI